MAEQERMALAGGEELTVNQVQAEFFRQPVQRAGRAACHFRFDKAWIIRRNRIFKFDFLQNFKRMFRGDVGHAGSRDQLAVYL